MKALKILALVFISLLISGTTITVCYGNGGCNSGPGLTMCEEICPGGIGEPCTYMDCGSGTELCEYDDHLPIII
jgi:hypothetical protein